MSPVIRPSIYIIEWLRINPTDAASDYWIHRCDEKLSALGEVTLIFSKRRFHDPPHKIKRLVTNLPEASACEILSHFARRRMIEVTFKEIKTGLHLGQMQVTKEERRIRRGVVLPVMADLLLLRLDGSELEPEQGASLFALKQRFIEEAYQEQLDRTESRFKQKLERPEARRMNQVTVGFELLELRACFKSLKYNV